MRVVGLLWLVSCALLAACNPTTGSRPSAWSAPQLIAPALQWNAPAAAASRDQVAFVWTGFDGQDVHQDARVLQGDSLKSPVILPLPPTHPLDQQLRAGAGGAFHLFWLDAAAAGEGNRLYSAFLRPDLAVERGPVELSAAPTYQFAVIADGSGGTLAVWSEGHAAEPELWAAGLDATGLPRQAQKIAANSQHPALTGTPDGAIAVFRESEGRLWIARWADDGALEWTALTATVGRQAGDRLDALWAAPCLPSLCVGWNLVRQNGAAESWLASGTASVESWNAPRPLEGLTWLTPSSGTGTDGPLYAAAQSGAGLALVTIHDGHVGDVETAIAGVALDGSPALIGFQDRWVLAWAEPETDYANLRMSQRTMGASLPPETTPGR